MVEPTEAEMAGDVRTRFSEPVGERLVYCARMLRFHDALTELELRRVLARISVKHRVAKAPLPPESESEYAGDAP